MDHLSCLTVSFLGYLQELFFPLLLGFIFSGIINEFVPSNLIQKYLGDNSIKAILMSTLVGTILPVCCMGSLPIAVTFRAKGAKLGPILAFLVATPATSAPALFASWKMMGLNYTLYSAFVVVIMGLVIGVIGGYLRFPDKQKMLPNDFALDTESHDCCGKKSNVSAFGQRVYNVLEYSLYELPRKIGLEILLGALVAGIIVSFSGVQDFVQTNLSGIKGYFILILIGLIDYVCSTGSVPVANALVHSGVSAGKSMVYLLMGPVTSYGTLLVIRKEFGGRVLCFYVLIIAVITLLAGVCYDLFIPT